MNLCCHCRRTERQEPGELVVGKLAGRPYRAYLCADHRQMLIDDGLAVYEARSPVAVPAEHPSLEAQRVALRKLDPRLA